MFHASSFCLNFIQLLIDCPVSWHKNVDDDKWTGITIKVKQSGKTYIHWFHLEYSCPSIYTSIHLSLHLSIHSFIVNLLVHSFINSFIYSFIHLFMHSFVQLQITVIGFRKKIYLKHLNSYSRLQFYLLQALLWVD